MGTPAREPPARSGAVDPPTLPQVVGRYAIHQMIASGGMGTVHYGRFLGPAGFARTVAIKKLHPELAREKEYVTMLADEARLVSRIRHPNVIPTLDVVEDESGLFVIMEYVHGEAFSRLIKAAGGDVPPSIAVAIMIGVLRGLHAAHEAKSESGEPLGVIHRDVSPQNILVGADGQPRVLDFGVAKATVRLTSTREGQLKGKLAYMSPEQLHGEEIDRRSDVYAASVVLWEALAGARLFEAPSEGALLKKILEGVKKGPSSATRFGKTLDMRAMAAIEQLDSVVLRGLSLDPANRFATAREMAVELEAATRVASVERVEEWVSEIAGPVLSRRAETLRAIESLPEAGGSSSPIAFAGVPSSVPTVVESAGNVESVESGGSLTGGRSAVKPTRRRRGPWIVYLVVAFVSFALAAGYAVWRQSLGRAPFPRSHPSEP
jgi:serine/threonine protein kinase